MMTFISRDKTQRHSVFWKTGAVLFWLLLWQLASMGLQQEILLASPVSVAVKLGQLVFTADCVRISSGFNPGNSAGRPGIPLLGVLCAASAVDNSHKVNTRGLFYYLMPYLDSLQESVSVYLFSHGTSRDLYKYIPGHPEYGSKAAGDGPGVFHGNRKKDRVYLCIPAAALPYIWVQPCSGTVLEGWHGGRGDRDSCRFYRRKALPCQDILKYSRLIRVDHCNYRRKLFI